MTQSKIDLTQYQDTELSLRVFNDEALYNLIDYEVELFEVISELFNYTDRQFEVLTSDLNCELA